MSELLAEEAAGALAEVRERLERALAASPADETSFAWLETWRRRASDSSGSPEHAVVRRRDLLVRVMESRRLGAYRTDGDAPHELPVAIRQALAQARAAAPIAGLPRLPHDDGPTPDLPADAYDPELLALRREPAAALLRGWLREGERAELEWREARLLVLSSRGLRRSAAVTTVALEVRCGRAPGAGSAAGACRSLAGLAPELILARARHRHGAGEPEGEPAADRPLVLAPEAVAQLLDVVSRRSLTAESYRSGESFLREHLGVQVFDRAFGLRDDATDPSVLPFPFDLEGTPKRPIEVVSAGVPRTPALNQQEAALSGLAATPHATAGDDARFEHLALAAGDGPLAELLTAADGGTWVARLGRLECFDARRLQIRAVAGGARRIRDGILGPPLPDFTWEVSLLQALGKLLAVGAEAVTVADPSGILGGIRAPAVALAQAGVVTPAA